MPSLYRDPMEIVLEDVRDSTKSLKKMGKIVKLIPSCPLYNLTRSLEDYLTMVVCIMYVICRS